MKIVQFGPYPLDTNIIKGGIESSIYGLSVELSSTHEIVVIPFPKKDIIADLVRKDKNVNVHLFKNFYSYDIMAIFRLKKVIGLIKSVQPDFCHLHGSSLFCLLLSFFLKYKKIPFTITIHGLLHVEFYNQNQNKHTILNSLKYYVYSLIEYKILSVNLNYIVDTTYVKDRIVALKNLGKVNKASTIHVIPQGINEDFYHLKEDFSQFNILSVGSISERKGHLYTIKAIHKLIGEFPLIKLIIAGVKTDELYFNILNEYIQKHRLENYISIYTDLPQYKIYELYTKANIFAMHSEEESQGIAICEAMACGKAIVATNVGGIPNIVQNSVNGLLSDFGDIERFSGNIKKILINEELRFFFHTNNLNYSKRFSWKYISEQIVQKCYKV